MSKRNILLNETGQMAVFVALIFQVLFVLFAMVINIGLIVHDKINLQNSVDLAAYYAASKQAESMNMIAHINYQMRQDYKLLAWRYRVLGSFGSDDPFHPAIDQRGGKLLDVDNSPGRDAASVCLGHKGWNDSFSVDPVGNQCRTTTMVIPDLKPLKYVPLSLGFNAAVIAQFSNARDIIRGNCQKLSPYNWGLATMMISSFRLSISERKKQIQKISSDISKADDFLDVEGKSVREGALKTFEKNLTASNRSPESFVKADPDTFQIVNGLSLGGCEQTDELGFPAWLVDIPISPIVRYTELKTAGSSSQCTAETKSYDQPPSSDTLNQMDPSGKLRELAGEPQGKSMLRSSRGFEKNPWCLAYVGVKAKTKPRKPFAPFGDPITMEAKAIAEPFGGRIGPWYGKTWAAQASQSDQSNPVDPLAVPRGDFDTQYKQLFLPNYSRFPGDALGLKSKLALGLLRAALMPAFHSSNTAGKFNFSDFQNILNDFWTTGDSLSWGGGRDAPSRRLEIAAVVPDLFDITYYSVDPYYYGDYALRAQDRFQGIAPMSDIGARFDREDLKTYSVKQQYVAMEPYKADAGDAYYLTKQWQHLLTGWTQGGAVDYSPRSPAVAAKFGICEESPAGDRPAVPGSCVSGGRVGYSVRLVHKDYLLGEHELGGSGAGSGRIKNPPTNF